MTDYTGPHWDRSALVVIDVQNDFLDGGAATIDGTSAVLPAVADVVTAFRAAGRPIAHLIRLYPPGGSDVDPPRRDAVERGARVVAPGSRGAQIPGDLLGRHVDLDADLLLSGQPQRLADAEVIMFKPRWSGFHRTRLEAWLTGHGCDTVVVAGCNLPNCPRATLFDASERDFRAVLVADAISRSSDERIGDLRGIGVTVVRSSDVRAALASTG